MTWRGVLLLLVALGSGALLAPSRVKGAEPAPPDLEALEAEALRQAPSLQALGAGVRAAGERVEPAGALQDPMVGVAFREMGAPWAPMREATTWEVEVSQGLPWPGKRDARRSVARAQVAVREAVVRQAEQRLLRDVRTTVARLYALDQERGTLDAAGEMLDLLAATARSRYEAGQAEQEALVKAQLEASRLRERRGDLDAARDEARIELNRLLGRPAAEPFADVLALPAPALAEEGLEEAAIASYSALAVVRAEVDAARAEVEASRLEAKPDFDVGVGAGTSLAPDPMLSLRVGLSLPFWREQKQDRLVAAAEHDVRAAEARLRDEELRTRSEIATLATRWRRDGNQATLYREAILPQAALAMDAARAGYLAGRGDFSMVVEDFRLWLEARVELARREAGRFATWAEVQELTTAAPSAAAPGETP